MSIWLLIISSLLIKGVHTKKRSYIMIYLIIASVCIFFYFLQMFTGNPGIIATSGVSVLIEFYGFIVCYSLYNKIETYVQID